MEWRIKLFAGLTDRLHGSEAIIYTETGTLTPAAIKRMLSDRHPDASALIHSSFIARNMTYAHDDEPLDSQDEIALIPPVSGGSGDRPGFMLLTEEEPLYAIRQDAIDIALMQKLVGNPNHGASLLFVGTTREMTGEKRTVHLEYEAYEPMAVKSMEQIGTEIEERWPGTRSAIRHRIGIVPIGEASVVIAVSAPHRSACYEASRYAIDRLKQIVPIWKKERWENGEEWQGHQQGPWDPTSPLDFSK